MNHDITHCNGIDSRPAGQSTSVDSACPRRDTCQRYLAHLDTIQHHFETPLYYTDASDCIDTNYKLYYTYSS